jgi:hypothetical protein
LGVPDGVPSFDALVSSAPFDVSSVVDVSSCLLVWLLLAVCEAGSAEAHPAATRAMTMAKIGFMTPA